MSRIALRECSTESKRWGAKLSRWGDVQSEQDLTASGGGAAVADPIDAGRCLRRCSLVEIAVRAGIRPVFGKRRCLNLPDVLWARSWSSMVAASSAHSSSNSASVMSVPRDQEEMAICAYIPTNCRLLASYVTGLPERCDPIGHGCGIQGRDRTGRQLWFRV